MSMSRRVVVQALLMLTAFSGAALMLLLEPMLARQLLPEFGGAASVWTTCMLFFQTLVLAGYAYGDLASRPGGGRGRVALHLLILGAAVATLPVLSSVAAAPSGASPVARLLGRLLVTAGLPFAVTATTATLVQSWWSRVAQRATAYRLYALSNVGSLAGLLAYPFLVEPNLGLREQAHLWSAAFAVYVGVFASCAVAAYWWPVPAEPGDVTGGDDVSVGARLWWLILSICGCVALLAVTSAMTQNVAPTPFLWLLPLGLYLLSFVICFEHARWYHRGVWMGLFGVSMLGLCALLVVGVQSRLWVQVAVYCAAMFTTCMVCCGELYRLRPATRHLGQFNLMIALGGAIGGVLVAIVAPMLFEGTWELQIAFAGAILLTLLRLWTDPASRMHGGRPRMAWFLCCVLTTMLLMTLWITAALTPEGHLVAQRRGFYGVLKVVDRGEGNDRRRILINGAIIHGMQFTTDARRREAAGYYWPGTGIDLAIRSLPEQGPRHIGVLGLGAGTLATAGRAGDQVSFYEINPQDTEFARRYFSFLADSPATVRVLEGDARLTLEGQKDQGFDLLVVDTFSGDAIPTHLLTKQAMALYLRHLKPDGLLALQVTNRHLDLRPVVARLAENAGLAGVVVESPTPADKAVEFPNTWIILAADGQRLKSGAFAGRGAELKTSEGVRLWTDDYSNLLQILH